MAELYENPKHYVTAGGTVGDSANGEPTVERMLAELPPEEREEAMQYITAPPSGEEIMRAMHEKNSKGEVMNMTLDQYRLFKAHNKSKEVDVIAGIGEAASAVFEEISKAAGSVIDNPIDATKKLTPSVIEAFAQGTRNLYGMAAQSADPNSVFFRMKNALQANGDDEEAEYQQFMEAQAFNVHSMRLMTGQDTIIMDKDVINPEMTQVMSYIADPTLFVPFGGLAAKGATMIGMGEKLAMASARTQAIRNMVLGGAIKWGVGAPLEFMGGAIRNTIDYGIETGSRAFETVSGVSAKDIQTTARLSGWGTASASVAGFEVNSSLGSLSKIYAGSSLARNLGEAASIYGEQMMKQGKIGRGVLGYAGQAIRDTERAGIKLSPQTKSLLKAIEAVDPLFVYADDIAQGAAQGAIIGGTLGYLAGGEEGFASGAGAGIALGSIGAGAGKVVSDVTGNTKIDQMAIQRKLIIEALKENGNENAIGFEAMAKMAEATGDRAFQGYIDGIIAGIDTVNPDSVFKAFNTKEYKEHLTRMGIDPDTGVLLEKSRIFPELNDRTVKADVLSILRDTGNRFAGDPAGFEQAIKNAPEFAKLKPLWSRLDDNAKAVILKQIKDNADPEFVKGLRGRQLNAHWSDLAYSERLAEMINTLNQKNSNSVPDKIREILKAETRSDKKLTRRGQMLKEKLQADGYIDKDGNIRQRRLADVEGTQGEFEASAGWAKRRDSNGRTEVVINLDKWAMDSGNRLSLAHELYHSIMMESVFAPDYIDRLSQKLLGKFDTKTGRVLEPALVPPDELMKFFGRYIENDPNNKGDAETIKRKKEELKKSIEEYRTRGTANRVADPTAIPLEHLVEEFGAYYFSKWVKAQSIDYMFRGGELGGIRGLMEMVSDGWLDYWKGKVGEKNPNFNFDAMGERGVSKAFERDGKRVSSRSLDLFMRDIVRIEANRNSNNGFDVNKLSKESREWFLKVNGLRGAAFGQLDQQGNVKRPKLRRYTAEEIRQGKEMFKVLESLPDAAHKDGMRRDGDGNWSGQPNTAQINALVGAGYIQRAWFDRMTRAFDIVNGNGSNVVEFGYLGYSAHIGDGNERVYGAAVPFKNRRAVLIGVDFKVRADGTVFSNLHTLDLKVIEARGNEVWKDPQTRELWKGNRTDMEADFYAYLSNASLPSDHPNRKPSARLLDKGDGLGGQRRDALHQMLGFHKGSDLPYINRPIAEIPVGIRHSVTTFSNDGIVNMRVDNKPRYDFNFENAHLDLSRNFMPDEMTQETTPSGGKIIKHATGYQISKQAGTKFKVFDPEGKHLGDFDTVADAGRAAQKHFNEAHEAKTEGKDPAVPRTEIPPSRQAYIEKGSTKSIDKYFGNHVEKFRENLTVLIDRIINGNKQDSVSKDVVDARLTKIKESVSKGDVKIADLEYIRDRAYSTIIDTSRLPYFDYSYFWERMGRVVEDSKKVLGDEYDAMYPMEIKSALHGQLAQIFQDHPNITAQGLLKKLVTYGSRGSRFFQEATEIGLVDMLKAKIQRTTSPMRMEDGRVIQMPRGGETQPKLDMAEILDFAKSKEIRVTIEEGAREVNNMDTSRFTLGGAKANYKQTAVRINPEYAHGIRGHYGKDTIVHFRTTERINADGTRHLFIEEVQANNTDLNKSEYIKPKEADVAKELAKRIVANQYISKLKKAENALERKRQSIEELNQYNLQTEDILSATGQKKLRRQKELFNIMLRNYIDAYKGNYSLYLDDIARAIGKDGAYAEKKNYVDPIRQHWVNTKKIIEDGSLFAELEKYFINDTDTKVIWKKLLNIQKNQDIYSSNDRKTRAVPTEEHTLYLTLFNALEEIKQGSGYASEHIIDFLDKKINNETSLDTESIYTNIGRRIPGIPLKIGKSSHITNFGELGHKVVSELADAYSKDKDIIDFLKEKVKVRKQLKAIKNDLNSIQGDISYFSYGNAEGIGYVSSERLAEILSLANTRIDKFNTQGKEPVFPLTSAKDWTLTALKGIIRQAIRDGLDKITLTHPDDSPPTSNMKPEPRRALYGKLIPEVWGSWLRKYGIELKQEGRLATDSIDKARADFTATQDKVAIANKAVLDKFNEVGRTENPQIINSLSVLLATPVHEWKSGRDVQRIKLDGMKLNDESFSKLVQEAGLMKEAEYDSYVRLNKLREDGIRATSEKSTTDEGISAEAIDRGMTFELNDRIKREFLEGRINTHSMPSEEGATQGGRVYDFNSPKFKSSFIGKYAEENPERLQNKNIEFVKRRDGSYRITMTDNSGATKKIGHITADLYNMRVKGEGIAEISSNIDPKFRGNKLANILYSEMAERLRAMGVKYVDGTIVNKDGIPVQVRNSVIGQTYYKGSNRPAFREDAAKQIQAVQSIYPSKGVGVYNELYKQGRYMPAEDINTVVTGNLNDILRTTGGAYHTHNITGLIEQYIHRFKGADVGEISRYVELKEEHNRLDRALSDSEDYYNSLSEEESRNPPDDAPNLPEDIRDEMSPIMDEMNDLENSISTSIEDDRSTSFSDLVTLYEQANELQKHAEKVRKSSKGFQYWDSFKRRFLKSENEEVFSGVERVLRDNQASKLPKLFVSELYSGHSSSGETKGLVVDILKQEGKLKKDGLTYGSTINPQRLINLLRNKAGSGNKAFTEAQAIGFIDWLKLRMGGVDKDTAGGLNLAQPQWALKSIEDATQHRESLNLKGKQNTIPTREVIDWLDKNQLDVRVDRKPVPNVDSDNYVAGGETEGYRDLVIRMPERYSHGVEGHFGAGKTNVVAHVRVTFRRDAEGKRVMHIEEIQANNANVDVLPPKERETYKQVLKELAQAQLNYEAKSVSDVGYFNLKTKADKEAVGAVTAKSIEEGKPYGGKPVEDARKLVNREKQRIEDDFQDKSRWANLSFKKFEEYVNADFQKKYPDVTNYLRHIYDRQMAEAEWRLEAKKSLEKTKLWNNEPEQLSDVDPKTGIKYPAMSEIGRLRSEIQSASEKEGNKAPLQDPKEWIKLAFRTILREATVEGVDRVTITPYDKTPMQVGMNKDSAKSLYEKIIPQYFESELAKVNQKLDIKNKNNSIIEQRLNKEYIDLKDVTQKRIKDVSDKWDRTQPTHPDTGEVFRFLHEEDSTLLNKNATLKNGEFNSVKYGNYKDKISNLAEGLPSGSNRNLVVRAVNAKFQQMNHYVNMKFSDATKMDAFGESASLVDRSIGFDMTEKAKELGKKSRPNFMPSEYTEFKSEQSPMGRIMRNAKGYVITMANNKFRVYNPAKAILGVYGSEEEAKKRIYREIPKQ